MQITIDPAFAAHKDNQLIIILQGDKEEMILKLQNLVYVLKHGDRPGQGVSLGGTYDHQIITPVWNGEKY